jgi:Lar family restriction alleviation protein
MDYSKLHKMVMTPRPTVPTVPLEQLKAQAENAVALVRERCPFCGDTRPALPEWDNDPFEPDNPLWHAECQGCGAHGPVTSSAQDAAVKWNVRA